jgi:CPA1 family monovalent cation:H+ antiporter
MDWAAAFTLGAIVSATDPVAATTVFRRLGVPQRVVSVLEGEGLFNDATALVAYRTAAMAAVAGSFVPAQALLGFLVAAAGGIVLGVVVGFVFSEVLRRLDNPPVEVAITLVIPYAAYLPADHVGLSGVLGAVAAGLVVGRRSAIISSPDTRVLGLSTWQMVTFLLNGFAFVLIGLELPAILEGLADQPPTLLLALALLISGTVIATRFIWVSVTRLLPGSLTHTIAANDPQLASRITFLVGWSGLRGVVALAAALALPTDFPQRNLIVLLAFAVILATLVGQGATLPLVLRWARFEGGPGERDEEGIARAAAYEAGLAEIERLRQRWPTHQPLLDRFESSLRDRDRHLATDDPAETEERRQERLEHEEIQLGVISAQRRAVIELRDRGEINDQVLRTLERELDLEEIRMEA